MSGRLALHTGKPSLERRERRWRNAAIGLLLVGVILALGRYAGLFGLQLALPVIGRFRAPSRYLVLANFSIAVLAALALSRWERQGAKLESVRWIVAMPAISLVATFLLIALAPPGSLAGGLLPWLGVAMWSASGAAVLLAAWRPSVGLPLMVAVAALDLGSYGFSYAVMGPTVRQLVQVAPLQDPARPGDGKLFVGPDAWDARSPRRLGNSLVLRGWTQADGYAGLEPRSLLLSDPIGRSNLQAAGVKWVRSGSVKQPIPGLVEAVPGWLEVPDPVPRFRLVTRTLVTTRPGVDMHAVDPHRIALVEHDVTLRDGDPGWLRVVRDQPGEIVIDVRCRGPQLLVTTERSHPGWRVLGHSGQLVRVNGDFLGVRVEPGERRVTLRFVPPGLATGHRLALVGSLGLLVAQLAARARPRSNKEARGRLWRN